MPYAGAQYRIGRSSMTPATQLLVRSSGYLGNAVQRRKRQSVMSRLLHTFESGP